MSVRDEPREIPLEDPDEEPADDATELAGAAAEEPAVATEDLERELGQEMEALQDRLLRLQAEFDNYRKREARERSAAWARAKADLAQKLLGALDDLQRVAHLDPAKTAAAGVIDGVSLVERKISDTLAREGLTRIGEVGEPFDPHRHEAISTLPAASPEQAGLVAAVAVPGYEFGSQLLRPAQVLVYEQRSADAI
ncbi:MAG TPA: nucleotide exchange factor GrpE [Gemmatimonadota bacterium]|nr:nucleotide exchange factor GrpE [Gemmatimonadota bacterium]